MGERKDLDLVEQAVLDIVEAAGAVRPHVLARELRRSEAMDEMEASLEDRGFIRSNAVQQRMMTAVAVLFAPIAVVGAARVVIGLRQGEAIGNLLVLLAALVLLFGAEVLVPTRPVLVAEFVQHAWRRQVRREDDVIASLAAETPTIDEARALAVLGVGVLWHANPVGAATLQAPTAMADRGHPAVDGSRPPARWWRLFVRHRVVLGLSRAPGGAGLFGAARNGSTTGVVAGLGKASGFRNFSRSASDYVPVCVSRKPCSAPAPASSSAAACSSPRSGRPGPTRTSATLIRAPISLAIRARFGLTLFAI